MKVIGVILSGCGYFDGSDIDETVLTLLAIERAGAKAICFAPDKPQLHVINHLSSDEDSGSRNMLVESSRLTKSNVLAINQADSVQLDALIVPGGSGATNNLSNLAQQAEQCVIDTDLQKLTHEIYKQGKPIGFISIAASLLPALLAAPVRVTIGTDSIYAEVIEAMGGIHVSCPVDDIVVDEEYRVVTTPASLLATSINQTAAGIDKLVNRVVDMIR